MKQYLKVEYRDIAKMLASAIPVEGEAFRDKVESYLTAIKAMPQEAKNALKVAFIFSRKCPREEREDLFQDLALACLKAKAKDEKLCYAIARCDWRDWWSKYRIRQHTSLDSVVEDSEGNATTLAELLVGEAEFETKMNGELDGERLWDKLPADIKPLVSKRLIGKALTGSERVKMSRFVAKQGVSLLLA